MGCSRGHRRRGQRPRAIEDTNGDEKWGKDELDRARKRVGTREGGVSNIEGGVGFDRLIFFFVLFC
jgi:hypothetical protein